MAEHLEFDDAMVHYEVILEVPGAESGFIPWINGVEMPQVGDGFVWGGRRYAVVDRVTSYGFCPEKHLSIMQHIVLGEDTEDTHGSPMVPSWT